MCVEISSAEEDDFLRAQPDVMREAALLDHLLAHNNSVLWATGIAMDVMRMDGHAYQDAMLSARHDVAKFYDIELEEAQCMLESDDASLEITAGTQFRVGENLEGEIEDPCDPEIDERQLHIVVWNGPDDLDHIPHQVGTKYVGGEGEADEFDPKVRGVSGDLWLTERKLAVVDALLQLIKDQMAAGRLPHLGLSGRYDTLVIPGAAADPNWDYAADAPLDD